MRRLIVVVMLCLPMAAMAECPTLTPDGAKAIASALSSNIKKLEKDSASPRKKPTLILKAGAFGIADTSALTVDTKLEELEKTSLAFTGCLDGNKAIRDIMLAINKGDVPLAFVSHDTDAFVKEVLDRIARIGHDTIDADTASKFAVRDINYVVVLNGHSIAYDHYCAIGYKFQFDITIHSIDTREIRVDSATVKLSPQPPDRYNNSHIELDKKPPYPEKLLFKSIIDTPLCIGKVKITARDTDHDFYSWTADLGCIAPRTTKPTSPPRGIELRGPWEIKAKCDKWTFYGFKLNE